MIFRQEEPSEQGGIAAQLVRVAEGMGKLFSEHLALARLEVAEDAKEFGKHAAFFALFVPFLFIGYALLCVGLALYLSRWFGAIAAFAAVGSANLLGGALGIAVAVQKLRGRPLLNDSLAELSQSASLVTQPASTPKHLHDPS